MAEKEAGAGTEAAKPGDAKRGKVAVEDQIAPLVASPTGPVPLSAVVADPKRAQELRRQRREQLAEEREAKGRLHRPLSREVLESLSGPERRAVARQRGYTLAGNRITVERFLRLQDEDTDLEAEQSSGGRKKA